MILVVALRAQHQKAEDEIIALEKSLRPDDFAPAVILAEAGAEDFIGVGF